MYVRSWPTTASRPLQVQALHGRTARSTEVQLACGPVTLLPPRFEERYGTAPLLGWAIRVWEAQTPAGVVAAGMDPLDLGPDNDARAGLGARWVG